jgi:amidohydrolase
MRTTTRNIDTARLQALIKAELPGLIRIRRDLHAHPELGYEERRTSDLVQRELRGARIEHRAGLAGGTGVLAHLPGSRHGGAAAAIGLRADMDALPIDEETDLPYRSTCKGVMHACGHDGHTAILLGAARVLAQLAAEGALPRPVTFVFQPAEEGGAGAARMIEDGCLDGSRLGPPIDHMFGLHGWPRVPLGVVGTRPGIMLAAADHWDLCFRGTGSHAAFPHIGNDVIVAAAALVGAAQTICSRNVSPLDSVVVSVTRFDAGTTYNVLPGAANLSGTVRTLLPATRDLAERRLGEIARGIAAAHGCTAEFDYRRGYPPTVNDAELVEAFSDVAQGGLGKDGFTELPQPVMGAEDFAFYGQAVPACFFILGLVPPGADPAEVPQLHQPTFDFNDDAIATGVEMFVRLAVR